MVVGTITLTTYKNDGTTDSGTPFVIGFRNKIGGNNFNNSGNLTDADIEIPPPPPPGDGTGGTGNPISTSYIDTMYVKVSDGTNDINAYQYFIDSNYTDDLSLNLAVRDYGGDNVVFKYSHLDVSGVMGTLAITNGTWTIDLVKNEITGTVTGGVPSISIDGEFRKVTIPRLEATSTYYKMNLKQYVVDSGPVEVTQTISLVPGWTWLCFYVDMTNTTLATLSNENVIGGCLIKAKIGNPASATYYVTSNYTGWFPTALDSNVWKNGISFQFNNPSQNSATISLTNTIPSTIDLTLSPGWNWIGFINSEEKTIVDVIPNGKAGYFIKRKTGNPSSAAYYVTSNYTGWFPANLAIIPGEGYQFNLYSDVFSSNETITISN